MLTHKHTQTNKHRQLHEKDTQTQNLQKEDTSRPRKIQAHSIAQKHTQVNTSTYNHIEMIHEHTKTNTNTHKHTHTHTNLHKQS